MKFLELDLHPLLQKNIEKVGYLDCTPIQTSAIPNVLQGRDIAGLAQTGTGKTAAFLVPIIDRILRGRDMPSAIGPATELPDPEKTTTGSEPLESDAAVAEPEELHLRYFPEWRRRNYVLILVPTRELAEQVYDNCQMLIEGTGLNAIAVYGGTTYEKQKAGFRDGVEFVIATPGRLIDLHKENICDLRQVRAVVFDEADRMFDMGFKDDMKFILKRIPRERQFLVFSATLNFDVLNVAYEFGAFPVEINISKDQAKADNVADEILHLGQEEKPKFLLSMLKKRNPKQAIIFSNFKHNVERIARFLTENGVPAVGISSLLTQAQRNRVMAQFKGENDRNILVATDLAARGLDILGVDMVINYELPDDPENYVHRIGRTGRAGHKGHALSLVSDRDVDALSRIEDFLGHKVTIGWLDDKEMVKDFKPFPSDFSRDRRPMDRGQDRGGGGGFRDRPRGGGRGGGRDSGRDGRRPQGEGRKEGRPHEARHAGGPRRDRPLSDRPQADRPQTDRPQTDRPQGDRKPHFVRPVEGGGERRPPRGGGGRPHRENRGPRDQQARDQGGNRPQRPRPAHHKHRRPNSGGQPPRHAMAAKAGGNAGLGQKVSGFFKKLFGAKD